MIICTCSRCISKRCRDEDGNSRPGQFVSRETQLKHHRADLKDSDSQDDSARSREGSPERETDNLEDLLKKQEGLDYEALHVDGSDSSITVITFVGLFLGWLHLFCGVSSANCQLARVFILRILETARNPLLDDTEDHQLPKDMRTIVNSLSISPKLNRQICCPTCFSLYQPAGAPWLCSFRKSPKARECGEALFELKKLYRSIRDRGESQKNPSAFSTLPSCEIGHPRNLYVTQTLSSWLRWFLSKSNIEQEILNWTNKVSDSSETKVFDIQQSEAWKEVTWPSDPPTGPKPLNLMVSLFIDWFNPRGNKKRGAQTSMGLFAYNCLDLPPSLRNLIQNTCVAGITPGPHAPDMTTITHVLRVHIDDLILLENGIIMPTFQYPEGRLVRVKLLTILGDMVGMHKVAGFASHSATLYCTWCWASSKDMDKLKLGKPRTKAEVLKAANTSNAAITLARKDEILKDTGVRWSEFNRLNYRDPVKHLPLGFMHNWFEGVLHHHFRVRWAFVVYTQEQKQGIKKKRPRENQKSDSVQHPPKRMVYEEGGGNAIDDDLDMEDGDESSDSELDVDLGGGWDGGLLSKEDILFFRKRLLDVVLPTGIPGMPHNLGDAKAGSLKASQWHSLFAYIIPLIIVELYVADEVEELKNDTNRGQILLNIANLCQCTNIVCAKKVSEYEAKTFETCYRRYNETSKKIFNNVPIVSNHHYALHIPDQMRCWGPLHSVAEFAGERLIGVLQKIPTNKRLAQMDGTIMTRISQWQRLLVNYSVVDDVVNPSDTGTKKDPKISRYRIKLDIQEYELLLKFSQVRKDQIRDYRDYPHPPNARVLQPYAIPRATWSISKRLLVSVMKPNNCIQYKNEGKTNYGLIRQIYEYENEQGKWETVCLVSPIINLYPKELESPSRFFRYLIFLLKCVVGQIDKHHIIVHTKSVVCVAAYRLLPQGVFGIKDDGIMLRPYDYNSQLDIV